MVGDIVNGVFNATGNFQPAAGVEVCLTFLGGELSASNGMYLYDGATAGAILVGARTGTVPIRIFITNTRYLRFNIAGAGQNEGYTGYQIK